MDGMFAIINEIKDDTQGCEILNKFKRPTCPRCRRPVKVCWCQFLPLKKINIKTTVYILQHPYEESRCLQTAAMLVQAFDENHCKLFRGKHFSVARYPEIHDVAKQDNSFLLFPSETSVDIKQIVADKVNEQSSTLTGINLFVLDGTWSHAKGIYFWNKFLHDMKQVKLSDSGISKYTIRTQPTDAGLSTVESVALAIKILENREDVYEALMKPLEALCNFQLGNGAVIHHSKEHLQKFGLKYPVKNKKSKYQKWDDKPEDITMQMEKFDILSNSNETKS